MELDGNFEEESQCVNQSICQLQTLSLFYCCTQLNTNTHAYTLKKITRTCINPLLTSLPFFTHTDTQSLWKRESSLSLALTVWCTLTCGKSFINKVQHPESHFATIKLAHLDSNDSLNPWKFTWAFCFCPESQLFLQEIPALGCSRLLGKEGSALYSHIAIFQVLWLLHGSLWLVVCRAATKIHNSSLFWANFWMVSQVWFRSSVLLPLFDAKSSLVYCLQFVPGVLLALCE